MLMRVALLIAGIAIGRRARRGSGERADVIAYLEQRRGNAALMAKKSPEFAEVARERDRQLGVIIEELQAGMHDGAAIARAALLAGDGGQG